MTEIEQLTVDLRAAGADGPLHRVVLAGMPRSYRITDAAGADVLLVSGRTFDPSTAALLDGATRAIMVATPAAIPADAVADLVTAAGPRGVLVVPAMRYGSLPPLLAAQSDLASDCADAAVMDGLSSSSEGRGTAEAALDSETGLREALFEQLTVLRVLGVTTHLDLVNRAASHYMLAGRSAKSLIGLAAYRSPVREAFMAFDIVGATRRSQLRFQGTALARRGVVVRYGPEGVLAGPASYESGFRIGWSSLHERILSGSATQDRSFVDDLAQAQSILA